MPTAREIDANGYLTIRGCPISSYGIFDYGAGQLGLPGDPNRIVKVYRPESAVNEQEAIDSFKNVPFINDHEMLSGFQKDDSATAPEDYGISGILTSNVYYEAPWMRGDLKVFARDLQADLQSGKKDLSLGYSCEFEEKPGVFEGQPYEVVQTKLRGNHIALVDEGRVKGARVLDGLCFDHLCFEGPSDKEPEMPKPKDRKAMDNAVQQLLSLIPALQQFLKEEAGEPEHQDDPAANANVTPEAGAAAPTEASPPAGEPDPAEPESSDAADLPTLIASVEQILSQLKSMTEGQGSEPNASTTEDDQGGEGANQAPGETPAADEGAIANNGKASEGPSAGKHTGTEDSALRRFYADSADKARIYDRLSSVVGAFDHAAMDANQVAVYGVKKLGLKAAAGQERVVLDGYLTGIEAAKKATGTTKAKSVSSVAADSSGDTEIDNYLKGAK